MEVGKKEMASSLRRKDERCPPHIDALPLKRRINSMPITYVMRLYAWYRQRGIVK